MEEDDITIARRTRSHLKIDDSVLNDNLDLPDVDLNLYQTPGSERIDPDYNNFLNRLYSNELGQDTNTEDNDTEYVYNNDIYSHGWAFDLNEVQEFKAADASIAAGDNLADDRSIIALAPVEPQNWYNGNADPQFSSILNQQLRQQIQLLTQTYILTKNAANMRFASEEAEKHLQSYLRIFKDRTKPSNLLPALDLIKNYTTKEQLRPSVRFTWRHLPLPDTIKKTLKDHPNIFIYPDLLPEVSYSSLERPRTKPAKDTFTPNEDKLFTYALDQFRGEPAKYHLISSLLMPTKTKKQLINHVKNIKRSLASSNPLKLYFERSPIMKMEHELEHDPESEQKLEPEPEYQHPIELEPQHELVQYQDQNQNQNQEHEHEHEHEQEREHDQEQELEPEPEHEPEQEHEQEKESPAEQQSAGDEEAPPPEFDNIMDMDLDDLVAASSTISKPTYSNNNNNSENKYIRNLKLRKSMLNLMSHNFTISNEMSILIIDEFFSSAKQKLTERHYLHLLQLLSDLGKKQESVEFIYQDIIKFLTKIEAPPEFQEKVVIFLDLKQATKCGCAMSYLHWMRFFEFMQHTELYHDSVEAYEKKLIRLVDALQKDDSHKIKLAVANMVNKHPFLKREYDSLCLDEKPHQSLFICGENFDDITEPLSQFESKKDEQISPGSTSSSSAPTTATDDIYKFEHFVLKESKEELSYASQNCPCKCHADTSMDGQPTQHCGRCNLKFMRGRMYLVNKIKPILAEWSYIEQTEVQWTFEEDRDILEFCRVKAERSEESVSFDTQTFEELANGGTTKKTAREIAMRFNHLMEIYKDIGHQ